MVLVPSTGLVTVTVIGPLPVACTANVADSPTDASTSCGGTEIVGGAPYGATTVAGGDGSRQPTAIDLAGAQHQGELVAKTAAKLFG